MIVKTSSNDQRRAEMLIPALKSKVIAMLTIPLVAIGGLWYFGFSGIIASKETAMVWIALVLGGVWLMATIVLGWTVFRKRLLIVILGEPVVWHGFKADLIIQAVFLNFLAILFIFWHWVNRTSYNDIMARNKGRQWWKNNFG